MTPASQYLAVSPLRSEVGLFAFQLRTIQSLATEAAGFRELVGQLAATQVLERVTCFITPDAKMRRANGQITHLKRKPCIFDSSLLDGKCRKSWVQKMGA